MKRPLIAGNWKMNLNRTQAITLAASVAQEAVHWPTVHVALCPPAVYLDVVGQVLRNSPVALGGQNAHWETAGAYTGELSPSMLVDVGCVFVILGHSERRQYFGETDEVVNRKVKAALEAGLRPIVCLGETLQQREADQTQQVIRTQFEGSLADLSLDEIRQVVLAYEPVWAIGTGKVATPQQAEEVHALLRQLLQQRYNEATARAVIIQYGGSVKPENAAELLSQPNVDGALVGGASLKAQDFMRIVAAAHAAVEDA